MHVRSVFFLLLGRHQQLAQLREHSCSIELFRDWPFGYSCLVAKIRLLTQIIRLPVIVQLPIGESGHGLNRTF